MTEVVLIAWKPIEWLLTKLEHIEFVTSPAHVKIIVDAMTQLRSYAGWLIPLAGLGLLGWDVWDSRRGREGQLNSFARAAAILYPPKSWWRKVLDKFSGTRLTAIHPAPTSLPYVPQPTIRIDEVVKRLTGRGMLPRDHESGVSDIERACRELEQKARQGLLAMFGGMNFRSTPPAEWDQMLLSPIPPEFWDQHMIDLKDLLDPQNAYRGMTMKRTGRRLDRDERMGLWFDRKQVDEVWPADEVSQAAFEQAFNRVTRNKDGALLNLTKLRARGVKLRNDIPPFLSTAQLNTWIGETRSWMSDVRELLEVLSPADAEWFETLDAVPAARVPVPNVRLGGRDDREMFLSAFNQHDCRLDRLDGLLRKHGVGAPPHG